MVRDISEYTKIQSGSTKSTPRSIKTNRCGCLFEQGTELTDRYQFDKPTTNRAGYDIRESRHNLLSANGHGILLQEFLRWQAFL